jgi:hypothetical protein
MDGMLARSRVTAEALEWATVQGKHEEMHFLRRAALLGTTAVIETVGIDPEASGDKIVRYVTKRLPHADIQEGNGPVWRLTNLIALGERDEETDLGLDYRFARIEETYFQEETRAIYRAPSGVRHMFSRARTDSLREPDTKATRHYTKYGIVYYAGDDPQKPHKTVQIPGTHLPLMNHENIDARGFLLWSPEGMKRHYQSQIDHLARYIDVISELAELTGTYLKAALDTEHIRRMLPEKPKS